MTASFKPSEPAGHSAWIASVGHRGTEPWYGLYRYWASKHVGNRPPARRDLDPLIDIPQLVSNIILIDLLDDGYRYRLIGSASTERLGVDLTGKRVGASGMAPQASPVWLSLYDQVKADRRPRIAVSQMRPGRTSRHVLVILSLVEPNSEMDGFLVGAFFEGDFKQGSEIEGLLTQEIEF